MRTRAAQRRRRMELAGRRPLAATPAGRAAIALLLVRLALSPAALAQSGPPPSFEHEVKASFVYTVAKFVAWPAESFPDPSSPLVFAILGEDPIEESLQHLVAGKSVGGHPVRVTHLADGDEPVGCHVLYVGRSEASRLEEILARVGHATVLTVGEFDRFAQRGGVLRLRLQDNMVRFEVNIDAAERARLQISSKILKLGTIIRDRKRGAGAR